MKKIGFVAVLGVLAVFAAYLWLEQTPDNPASNGTNKLVHDAEQVVKNTQKIVSGEPVAVQGSIHKAEEVNDAVKKAGGSASAEINITAYVPSFHEVGYTDEAGNRHVFKVEIAEKPEELQEGLMFRHEMAEDHGMLFVFPIESERSFWMKNTYIPLDMFFIKSDGTILSIHKNAIPLDTTIIHSNGQAQFVLETNGGIADKLGIKPGDKFEGENFAN